MAAETQRVRSTAASFVSYDKDRKILGVTWSGSSRTYYYHGVPEPVYAALLNAPSVGKFLNANVRDRYPFS
jgi:lysyl-tRNA synthetase class 2